MNAFEDFSVLWNFGLRFSSILTKFPDAVSPWVEGQTVSLWESLPEFRGFSHAFLEYHLLFVGKCLIENVFMLCLNFISNTYFFE